MKLSKALKVKNQLVHQIKSLENRVQQENSKIQGAVHDYNLIDLMESTINKRKDLVQLKLMIEIASAPIRQQILQLSEMKSHLCFLRNIPTENGRTLVNNYRETREVVYVAIYTQNSIDKEIEKTQNEIECLQDEIDHHNHNTEVDVEVNLD